MKKEVLTVIYNLLSCHDWPTIRNILSYFEIKERGDVLNSIRYWKRKGVVYQQDMRDDQGMFAGTHQLINWDKFNYKMINNESN